MYTLFVDGRAVADITGDRGSEVPLVASVGALCLSAERDTHPALEVDVAAAVVGAVAGYVNYGSEQGQPCDFCSNEHDGLTLG